MRCDCPLLENKLLQSCMETNVQRPIILRGLASRLFPRGQSWTFDELDRRAGSIEMDGVQRAPEGSTLFGYADESSMRKNVYLDPTVAEQRHPPMRVRDFVRHVRAAGAKGSSCYLWAPIYHAERIEGEQFEGRCSSLAEILQRDLVDLRWDELDAFARLGKFGLLHTMQVFVSGAKAVTGSHYDQSQNIFLHLNGAKRFLLFPPLLGARALAPYPVRHPRDRQARVRLQDTDYETWPCAAQAHGSAVEAILGPGDGLFLPYGWWHHVESLESENVSINFWFKGGELARRPPLQIPRPLPEPMLLDLVRDVELFIAAAVSQDQLGPFLLWMHMPQAVLANEMPPSGEELRWLKIANFVHLRAAELVPSSLLSRWLETLEVRRFAWLDLYENEQEDEQNHDGARVSKLHGDQEPEHSDWPLASALGRHAGGCRTVFHCHLGVRRRACWARARHLCGAPVQKRSCSRSHAPPH